MKLKRPRGWVSLRMPEPEFTPLENPTAAELLQMYGSSVLKTGVHIVDWRAESKGLALDTVPDTTAVR